MPVTNDAAGMAALTVVETILLLLIEKGHLSADELGIALDDASQIHCESAISSAGDLTKAAHLAAAKLIENLMRGSNLQAASRSVLVE